MNRGEVWWVETPGGRRPHLILTRTSAIPTLDRLLTVPTTGTIRGIPTEVALDRADGMPSECALTLDNVSTARKSHFVERICRLSDARMHAVCRALSQAVDCS